MTSQRKRNTWLVVAIAAAVIILDQVLKLWVKTHFYLGESYQILPFFELKFIQNNGMAFGMELGSKLFLTLFRVVVVGFIIWYIVKLLRRPAVKRGFLVTLTLIAAGAAGNIFDCLFYGEIFNNPAYPQVAQFVPWGEGYGTLFRGLVVDMLYFPLFEFQWPDWMPWVGGEWFSFFDPVFNIADSAITIGVLILVIFYTQYLPFASGDKKKD